MFSSEAFQAFSRENVDNAPRKPGESLGLQRKAFTDRSVNASSPTVEKNLKGAPFEKVETPRMVHSNEDDDDLFFYDTCSYIDVNGNYSDLCFLEKRDTLKILRSYAGYSGQKTPPPKFSSAEMEEMELAFEFPEMDLSFEFPKKGWLNETSGYEIAEISVDDISLPEL